ncbi:MAG: hypothetical protein M1828_006440 [Chrysothrix sp. TS-e1954]|nr:MAG: hypothetical protein M1828_006440 [Chrysothrix sp. TS-e1954]
MSQSASQLDLRSEIKSLQTRAREFLTSKVGHYAVLSLVFLDFLTIFADFVVSLSLCEHTCKGEDNLQGRELSRTHTALGIIGLVFSCVFLVELIVSMWAFGAGYFKSKFHVFDAVIITVGFFLDACLRGSTAEAGSIVIVLRLFRIVKIVNELSSSAQEHMEATEAFIGRLEAQIKTLKEELTVAQMHASLRAGRGTR